MPQFKYYFKDKGKKVFGILEADNMGAAKSQLLSQGIRPYKIHDAAKQPFSIFEKDEDGNVQINLPFMQPSIGQKDVNNFCKQFSVMIDAGLPMVDGLKILSSQGENSKLNYQIKEIANSIEGGASLSESLEKFPDTFNRLFCSMIRAGEEGGILDKILIKLVEFMDKNLRLRAKIKSAMMYPIIVIVFAVGVVTVIMVFVIPIFSKLFGDMGNELPWLTQQVIDFSDFVIENIIIILGITIGGAVGLYSFFIKNEKGRRILDNTLLFTPGMGPLVRAVAISRFTGTMATMLGAGVPIIDSLVICSRTAGNFTIEDEILKMKSAVMEGATITKVLSGSKIFPKLVTSMVSIGEESGNLDTMLVKVSDYYEEVVDDAVEALTALMEPILIVGLGGVIAVIVIAMYLPIFDMATNF